MKFKHPITKKIITIDKKQEEAIRNLMLKGKYKTFFQAYRRWLKNKALLMGKNER